MGQQTPLFNRHQNLGAKMVDFGGWDMPIHYGSQIEEHHAVRTSAGAFDVSHMTVLEIHGTEIESYLNRLLANDIRRMTRPGQAMYSAMLNEAGGVIDDLIVYATGDPTLVVVNCATREKDIAWMTEVAADFQVNLVERTDLGIIAVQGPDALTRLGSVFTAEQQDAVSTLKLFQGCWSDDWFLARTGYTGERGMEIILPAEACSGFWDALMSVDVRPVGLGARDTLRLEAGMNLYGSDMDEEISPFEANMASTVQLEGRDFVGADALRDQLAAGNLRQLVGLVLQGKGVLRSHYEVLNQGEVVGEITSGAFSPTLQMGIGLARVSSCSDEMSVQIRGKAQAVDCVTPSFVRHGQPVYKKLA